MDDCNFQPSNQQPIRRGTMKSSNITPEDFITYQDLLDQESVPVPEHLRTSCNPDMGSMRLDASRYTSQNFHNLETKHLWNKVWQFVCREEDLPKVGDHIVYDVAHYSFIVVRNSETEIRAFHNSCLHRGRKLVTKSGCKNSFRCPYHAWTWNTDGTIKSVPYKNDFEYAGDKNFNLPQVKVDIWEGFVFINPDIDSEPLHDYLGVLPEHFKSYELGKCSKVVHVKKVIPCNWKAALEAFMESYHVMGTHPQIMRFTADFNSQYDIFGDHVSRYITPTAVPSPHLSNVTEQEILNSVFKESGRMVNNDSINLPEGISARKFLADMNRKAFSEAFNKDFSNVTDSEVIDPIIYLAFPNIQIWGGFLENIVYWFRPDGDNPNSSMLEVMILRRTPEGEEKPAGVKPRLLSENEKFSDAEELGVIGGVFDQDMSNLPYMDAGLRAAQENGREGLILGQYQEARIMHLHRMIDKYISNRNS